jgi:hypothetical protein
MRSKNIRESLDQEHIQNKKRDKFNEITQNNQQRTRPIEQVLDFIFILNKFKFNLSFVKLLKQ